MTRTLTLCALLVSLAGCGTTVEMLASDTAPIGGTCDVTVYQTRAQALELGPIEELCVISGTTSGSFRHTIANAIEMHKAKACDCGTDTVFVEDRGDSGFSIASVTLIGFRHTTPGQ